MIYIIEILGISKSFAKNRNPTQNGNDSDRRITKSRKIIKRGAVERGGGGETCCYLRVKTYYLLENTYKYMKESSVYEVNHIQEIIAISPGENYGNYYT